MVFVIPFFVHLEIIMMLIVFFGPCVHSKQKGNVLREYKFPLRIKAIA